MSTDPLTKTQLEILEAAAAAVIEGDEERTVEQVQAALQADIAPLTILDQGLTPAIREVGEQFNRMEIFLPEMIVCSDAMQAGVTMLQPYFEGLEMQKAGTVVLGTVRGDIHDIGKNIFKTLLEVNGYEVIDLGRDVAAVAFVDEAESHNAQIIAMSGLLTTSLTVMKDTIELLHDNGTRDQVKVIVGGGPTSQSFAEKIGADGYGDTARDGVLLCDRLLAGS